MLKSFRECILIKTAGCYLAPLRQMKIDAGFREQLRGDNRESERRGVSALGSVRSSTRHLTF